jgi:hypothetical protein
MVTWSIKSLISSDIVLAFSFSFDSENRVEAIYCDALGQKGNDNINQLWLLPKKAKYSGHVIIGSLWARP